MNDQEELAALGYRSIDEAHQDIIERDGLDDSAWELTMSVPAGMRFNGRSCCVRGYGAPPAPASETASTTAAWCT